MSWVRISVVPICSRYDRWVRAYSTSQRDWKHHASIEDYERRASAYEVLGVVPSASAETIRAAFRELAKATHPDLQPLSSNTALFIRILGAYEILSDPSKRGHYDAHLRSTNGGHRSPFENVANRDNENVFYSPSSESSTLEGADVVEWLRGYRTMVREVCTRSELGVGSGVDEKIKGELQAAIKRAYFGPILHEIQDLPNCFEAEERAGPGISDVLQLVSGRQLFGCVREVKNTLLESSQSTYFMHHTNASEIECTNEIPSLKLEGIHNEESEQLKQRTNTERYGTRDPAFVDLELYLFGKLVARSKRVPSKIGPASGNEQPVEHDCIYVYASSEDAGNGVGTGSKFDALKVCKTVGEGGWNDDQMLLGTIHGLNSTSIGNICTVHDPDGLRTHMILQHKTPMVKHILWFKVENDEGAPCLCRCRRAISLPSRFWLFEPRTTTHNIGGWYIETFSKKRKKKVFGMHLPEDEAHGDFQSSSDDVHDLPNPALYILAAAYKTLDDEAAKRLRKPLATILKEWVRTHLLSSDALYWWKHQWKQH